MKLKAKENNYSVIIVSGATATNKEFVISSKLIRNSIIAFIVLLLIFGFIIFDYLNTSFNKEKMKRLERENIEKETTIDKLNADLREIEKRLNQMAVYKERISVAMGLTSPDALKEVGIGGGSDFAPGGAISSVPKGDEMPNSELINEGKKLKPSRDTAMKKAENIRQKAEKIQERLEFVESAMEKQKVRLAQTPSIWPTKGYLTSPLGWRTHPLTGKRDYHNGQDIATQFGNKIIATADGVVLVAGHWDYLGNLIIIDHGFGFTTRYGHLASFNVKEGDRVKRFQVIGYVGNTGRSSAPHLHYEVRYFGKPLNPMNFIID
ncbi:MAG: M23 family metallopeptidase [Candidatus Aminicenantes bacterium]|jgi:murein DD-endopeptidase MepM/ murein hydrolase activator NlpD